MLHPWTHRWDVIASESFSILRGAGRTPLGASLRNVQRLKGVRGHMPIRGASPRRVVPM